MKNNLSKISLIALILTAALCGCSSTPSEQPEQTDAIAAPVSRSSALTGTWKLAADDAPSQMLQFQDNGTGTLTVLNAEGQVSETAGLSYAFDDETRFRRIGIEWVMFVPCEVQADQLILTNTGQVFKKE